MRFLNSQASRFKHISENETLMNIKQFTLLELKIRGDTIKILKIGTPEIITIIVLQLEQLDFKVQYCVQKMQTE